MNGNAYVLHTRTDYVLAVFPNLDSALALDHYDDGDRIVRHSLCETDSGKTILIYRGGEYWDTDPTLNGMDREVSRYFESDESDRDLTRQWERVERFAGAPFPTIR